MQKIDMNEIDLYNTLIGFKKINGNDALAALLRKIGVKSPGEIDASRFPEVEMLCKAGTRGLGIVEGARLDATGTSDIRTIAAGAGSVAEGLDRVGRARNAGRKTIAG